jgi:hypothetical protein
MRQPVQLVEPQPLALRAPVQMDCRILQTGRNVDEMIRGKFAFSTNDHPGRTASSVCPGHRLRTFVSLALIGISFGEFGPQQKYLS